MKRMAWIATWWEAGTESQHGFSTLTDALEWINKAGEELDLDPEQEGSIELSYTKPSEDWMAREGDGALIMNRIVCGIVDGYAGGAGNYQLRTGLYKFWIGEPEDDDSDFILFSRDDR